MTYIFVFVSFFRHN